MNETIYNGHSIVDYLLTCTSNFEVLSRQKKEHRRLGVKFSIFE